MVFVFLKHMIGPSLMESWRDTLHPPKVRPPFLTLNLESCPSLRGPCPSLCLPCPNSAFQFAPDPRELSSVAWAFAVLGQADARLMMAVAAHATSSDFMETATTRELASLAWAFAKLEIVNGHSHVRDNIGGGGPGVLLAPPPINSFPGGREAESLIINADHYPCQSCKKGLIECFFAAKHSA